MQFCPFRSLLVAGTCLIVPGLMFAQVSPTAATTKWIDTATTYYEARETGEVRIARFNKTDSFVILLNGLRAALSEERNKAFGLPDRIIVLTGYRSVWKADDLLKPEWDTRVARLRQLPDDQIAQWQKALTAVNQDAVSDLWTFALVSDLANVFPAEKFDPAQSAGIRSRLPLIPAESVQSLGDVLKMGKANSVTLIIRNSDFFDRTGFRRQPFDDAIRRLQARLQSSK